MMSSSGLYKSTVGNELPDALTAVAFQDHLLRKLNVDLSLTNLSTKRNLDKRLAYRKPRGKAVVDSNRNLKKVNDASKERRPADEEYVLDPLPAPPTLAQRLGLVEQPRSLLNDVEWAVAKSKAEERQDFSQPCVICKEDIGKQCHVILSCSHVFHKNCLQAFERFSGKKSCPMCRKEAYQTRVVYDGVSTYKQKSATRIQACWRGYVVRCWYRKLRETVPPSDPKLRQQFFEDKLKVITDRMVDCMDLDVNHLLYEVSKNQESSRLIFEQFDARQKVIDIKDWLRIHDRALARQNLECPICLTSTGDTAVETQLTERRSVVLTSCSHLFHDTCLTMFEELASSEKCLNSCPVCRSAYQKHLMPSLCDDES